MAKERIRRDGRHRYRSRDRERVGARTREFGDPRRFPITRGRRNGHRSGSDADDTRAGLGIDSIEDVAALGKLCDRLGVDVIGVGNAVAWAIRAGEMGLVDYDGSFGDPDAATELITAIAKRSTPLGDVLADGLDAAGDRYGGRSLIPTVKGMSLPSYDPDRIPGLALAYATSDRGACHRRARPFESDVSQSTTGNTDHQVLDVIEDQDVSSIRWSLIVDDFVGFVFEEDYGAEWLRTVGYDLSAEELRLAGERIWNLTRLFNIREGMDRVADVVPSGLREDEDSTTEVDDSFERSRFRELLEEYYARRGWVERGIPTPETLERLGLADLDDDDVEAINE
ncbi:MAG: aldehyde ferredoxin oxidoreductase C-terminal domain-containing protein [Halodesulfurarchaeum sp.]